MSGGVYDLPNCRVSRSHTPQKPSNPKTCAWGNSLLGSPLDLVSRVRKLDYGDSHRVSRG